MKTYTHMDSDWLVICSTSYGMVSIFIVYMLGRFLSSNIDPMKFTILSFLLNMLWQVLDP